MSRFSLRPARASVAPLGSVGQALQTPATQATFRMPSTLAAGGIRLRRRKRRRVRKATRRHARNIRRTTRRKRTGRRVRLVKGSRAAKLYMRKLRAMRKRR